MMEELPGVMCIQDGKGEVGLYKSVANRFAAVAAGRVTQPSGKILTCLFADTERIYAPLARGASDAELDHVIKMFGKEWTDRFSEERSSF